MRIGRKLVFVAMLMLFSGSALAQIGCPPGYFPIVQGPTNQTVTTCVPEGDAGFGEYGDDAADAPATPAARWEDRWGAIATDAQKAKLGVVVNMPSQRKAKSAALDACKENGGSNCTVEISYYNQCAALITGDKLFNTSAAATIEEATESGLSRCSKEDTNCRVYYSGCSLPVRIQ